MGRELSLARTWERRYVFREQRIPFGDTISSVLTSTTANLTTAPSGTVSSETLAIQGGQTTSGTDYVFFSVNRGTASGCTNAAGDGCILSYNVTNPTAVSSVWQRLERYNSWVPNLVVGRRAGL